MSNNDDLIPVPRAELLAWAKAWLYEYGPNDGRDCVTPFDTYLLKSPADPVAADNEKAAEQACLAMIALNFYWNGETWVLPEKAEAKPVGNGVVQRHVVTKFSDGSTRVEDILTSPNTLGTMEGVEAALQKWLDWCNKYDEEPEARSGARIAIEALAKQQLEVPTWIDHNWAEGHTHPHEKSSGIKLTVRDGNWEGTFDEWQKRRPHRTARR